MDIINSNLETLPQLAVKKLKTNQVNYFSTFSWYCNFINTVTTVDSGNYSFLVGQDNESIKVVFPVEYSVLEGGGLQLKSLTNYYSPIYQLIQCEESDSETGLSDFFVSLKASSTVWDVMRLQPMSEDDVAMVSAQLKKAKIPCYPFYCFGNWYLEVNGRSYAQYLADIKPKVRSTIGTKTKQFEGLDGARIEIITTEQQNLDAAIAAYETVYASSWKHTEPYRYFISGLVKSAAQMGGLRLGLAYLGEQPIAAQIWLVYRGTACIFKVAYDEKYKQYAVGTVLTAKLMQYVLDIDKVDVVDYLQGDDPYKKNWMTHRRERWGILAFNTSTVRGNIELFKELLKRCFKAIKDHDGVKKLRAYQVIAKK